MVKKHSYAQRPRRHLTSISSKNDPDTTSVINKKQEYSPFQANQKFLRCSYALQGNMRKQYFEWLAWQQMNFFQMQEKNMHWLINCFALNSKPHTLFRYFRTNLNKPYLNNQVQAVNTLRLFLRFGIENIEVWQKAWLNEEKDPGSQVH